MSKIQIQKNLTDQKHTVWLFVFNVKILLMQAKYDNLLISFSNTLLGQVSQLQSNTIQYSRQRYSVSKDTFCSKNTVIVS